MISFRITPFLPLSSRPQIFAGVIGIDALRTHDASDGCRSVGERADLAAAMQLSNVVVDGRLVTGQNPFSAKATAKKVVELL